MDSKETVQEMIDGELNQISNIRYDMALEFDKFVEMNAQFSRVEIGFDHMMIQLERINEMREELNKHNAINKYLHEVYAQISNL